MTNKTKARWLPLAVVATLALAVVAGLAAIADQSAASGGGEHKQAISPRAALDALEQPGLSAETGRGLDIDPSTVTPVGSYALPSGGRHEVYRATARNGWTCILEERPAGTAPNGEPLGLYGGGCSPADSSQYALKISVSAAGNVDETAPRGLSIVGVAGSGIRRVEVRMADGAVIPLAMNAARGFHFAGASGHGDPTAVVGFDAAGRKVDEAAVR